MDNFNSLSQEIRACFPGYGNATAPKKRRVTLPGRVLTGEAIAKRLKEFQKKRAVLQEEEPVCSQIFPADDIAAEVEVITEAAVNTIEDDEVQNKLNFFLTNFEINNSNCRIVQKCCSSSI